MERRIHRAWSNRIIGLGNLDVFDHVRHCSALLLDSFESTSKQLAGLDTAVELDFKQNGF